jgi:hypothetical protein
MKTALGYVKVASLYVPEHGNNQIAQALSGQKDSGW